MSADVAIAEPRSAAPPRPDEPVLHVRGVGKMYRIYDRPQDRLKQMLLWRLGRSYGREFWALRNVSFTVARGEAIGIIGRNGSGKSTLLQLIAGTLALTEGEVALAGRIAALLELGSGFNPEFTGRENVYLNGSILGFSQQQIAERFAEIEAFADIGAFIDQPVKTYSSGMVVRLAFAVQAVVPKEVLIVDEALAVGDEAFQRKCMRVLERFREDGGTVLLVTHDANTIVRHCDRCLFLHAGEPMLLGPSKPVTDIYQRFVLDTPEQQRAILAMLRAEAGRPAEDLVAAVSQRAAAPAEAPARLADSHYDPGIPQTAELVYGNGQAEILDPAMYDREDRRVNVLIAGERYRWRYRVRFHERAANLNFGFMLRSVDGAPVVAINTESEGERYPGAAPGQLFEVCFEVELNLAPGTYFTEAGVVADTATPAGEGGFLQRRMDIGAVRVVPPDRRPIHGLAYTRPRVGAAVIQELPASV
jgi:lipopolysaccharide transport system ATP-binding protein